jgi:hypothetical protein
MKLAKMPNFENQGGDPVLSFLIATLAVPVMWYGVAAFLLSL